MKRLWFAFIFIIACVLTCAYEQYVVKSAYEDIIAVIDEASAADDSQDKAEYCLEITKKWDGYYKKIALVTDHSILESADISIGELEILVKDGGGSPDDILTETRSELEHIYESSRINLSNIF